MDSFFAQYLKERSCDQIIETDQGFATYRYLANGTVYIIDIFVLPQYRKMGIASKLADKICAEAKEKGFKILIGTVCPSAKNATESFSVLISYGMKLDSINDGLIVFKKDL